MYKRQGQHHQQENPCKNPGKQALGRENECTYGVYAEMCIRDSMEQDAMNQLSPMDSLRASYYNVKEYGLAE